MTTMQVRTWERSGYQRLPSAGRVAAGAGGELTGAGGLGGLGGLAGAGGLDV